MPQEFELKVQKIIQRSYNVKSVRINKPDENLTYKAGQFLSVALNSANCPKRYLSISSSPTESGYIEFTKKITGSDFSCTLDKLKEGDIVKLQYPFGKFTLEDNPAEKVGFLSGGIGITPIRSIIKYAVDKKLALDLALIYANRSVRDILFREDFDAMQRDYPKLKIAHVLCEPAPDFKCVPGLINAQVIKNEAPDYLERKFFLCGPPAMVEAMKKILAEELHCPQANIVLENFTGY